MDKRFAFFIPGDGWMLTHHESDGTTWSQRIVAWGFDARGEGHPITATDDGETSMVAGDRSTQITVWHPDLAPPAFDGMNLAGRPAGPDARP